MQSFISVTRESFKFNLYRIFFYALVYLKGYPQDWHVMKATKQRPTEEQKKRHEWEGKVFKMELLKLGRKSASMVLQKCEDVKTKWQDTNWC